MVFGGRVKSCFVVLQSARMGRCAVSTENKRLQSNTNHPLTKGHVTTFHRSFVIICWNCFIQCIIKMVAFKATYQEVGLLQASAHEIVEMAQFGFDIFIDSCPPEI